MQTDVMRLRGEGRWGEALELLEDPLARADALNEQALFTGDAQARDRAAAELDRAEIALLVQRGRIIHSRFLADRREDTRELELFERALELARALGDAEVLADALFWVGLAHQVVRGDHDRARPYLEEAYRLGGTLTRSYAIRHIGFVHDAAGRAEEARRAFEESVELRRADGFLPGVAAGLLTLGEVALEAGEPERARPLLEEARELAERVRAEPFIARIEEALARAR